MNFSELKGNYTPFTRQQKDAIDQVTDLILDDYVLRAPYGIFDFNHAEDNTQGVVNCFPGKDFSKLTREDIEAQFKQNNILAPEEGFSDKAEFKPCHLYFVRTAEGYYVALLHIGTHVGAYDRMSFFWIYKEDGSRNFLLSRSQ